MYNLREEQWEFLENNECAHTAQLERSKEPKARRNHVAGMIGNHMVVYGGIDDF